MDVNNTHLVLLYLVIGLEIFRLKKTAWYVMRLVCRFVACIMRAVAKMILRRIKRFLRAVRRYWYQSKVNSRVHPKQAAGFPGPVFDGALLVGLMVAAGAVHYW